jgi:hypothetical protein
MQPQSYTIPSATTPGRSYRVTVHADGIMSCDCPDATFRRRQCKHQRLTLVLWTAAGRAGAFTTPAGATADAAAIVAANDAAYDRTQVASILRGGW